MRKSVTLSLGILLLLALPLAAQPKMELTPFIGYTFGGSFDELGVSDATVESVNVNDSTSYGLIFDIGNENGAFEFTWSRLETDLEGRGGVADGLKVDYSQDNFQFGYIGYFGGDSPETKAFWTGSLGFTDFDVAGQSSDTKFSAALGVGLRHDFNDRIGVRVQARWIPSYINTDDVGVVCDPYFCYTVGDDNYLYQTEVSAGLVFKLGR